MTDQELDTSPSAPTVSVETPSHTSLPPVDIDAFIDDEVDESVQEEAPDEAIDDETYQEIAANTVTDEKIDKIVSILTDDRERMGTLNKSHIERIILKRNLSPAEVVSLFNRMKINGLLIEEDEGEDVLDRPGDEEVERHESEGKSINPYDFVLKNPASKKLLTRGEEVELGRKIKLAQRTREALESGDASLSEHLREILTAGDRAKERMVLANLRLVLFVSIKYKYSSSMEPLDLFQEGVTGLMKAADRFDPELGIKFSTYATWWIRQAIHRGLDDQDQPIRIPVYRAEQIRKLRRMKRLVANEQNGREPTVKQLSEELDWDSELTAFVNDLASQSYISIETPTNEEGTMHIGDLLISPLATPAEQAANNERDGLVRGIVDTLPLREQIIIRRRFGINSSVGNETLQEIGTDMNVTRERIRQIQVKAFNRLRFRARKNKLKEAL